VTLGKQHFVYALTLWLLVAQAFALEHAMSHELAGHEEACSICLDAAQFSSVDIAPGQVVYAPQSITKSTRSCETANVTGLFATPYASRAPPFFS